MRDPSRIPRILDKLRLLWVLEPDTRLCQLLCKGVGGVHVDLFYIGDDKLEAILDTEIAAIAGA